MAERNIQQLESENRRLRSLYAKMADLCLEVNDEEIRTLENENTELKDFYQYVANMHKELGTMYENLGTVMSKLESVLNESLVEKYGEIPEAAEEVAAPVVEAPAEETPVAEAPAAEEPGFVISETVSEEKPAAEFVPAAETVETVPATETIEEKEADPVSESELDALIAKLGGNEAPAAEAEPAKVEEVKEEANTSDSLDDGDDIKSLLKKYAKMQ